MSRSMGHLIVNPLEEADGCVGLSSSRTICPKDRLLLIPGRLTKLTSHALPLYWYLCLIAIGVVDSCRKSRTLAKSGQKAIE